MTSGVSQDRAAGTWQFDPIHSVASFTVKYLVAPFRAEFERLSAELVDGRVSGTVDVASLKVKDEFFAAQLQGPEFFDAERFPQISFTSDEIVISGDDVIVEGELTLKGVTKRIRGTGTIEGPAEDFRGNTRLGLAVRATIDRTEFGVSWNAPLPKGGNALANEVTLQVELEFIAEA
jgi:polyisoprenoid-binding protein YceI